MVNREAHKGSVRSEFNEMNQTSLNAKIKLMPFEYLALDQSSAWLSWEFVAIAAEKNAQQRMQYAYTMWQTVIQKINKTQFYVFFLLTS